MTRKILWILGCILAAALMLLGALGLFGQTAQAQPSMCAVSGTIYNYDGTLLVKHPFEIRQVKRAGYIIPVPEATEYTDSLGVVTFSVPRSNFATFDTTKVLVYVNAWPFNVNRDRGVWLIIPDAATADLATLPSTSYSGPAGFAAAVPTVYGGTTGNVKRVDTLVITGDGVDITNPFGTLNVAITGGAAADHGDSIRVADSLARLANTRVLSPLHADSIRVADSLARLARTENDVQDDTLTQLRVQIDTKQNVLTAAQIARIDSMLAAGDFVTITSQGGIRIISVDTTGWFARYGGVMTEVDPTAQAKISAALDSALTAGARSISSTGRIFVSVDSLTLDHLTNTIDCSLGNEWRTTTTQAADTIYFSNWPEGQAVTIAVTQGGTGQTVVFDGVRFVTAPTITATQYKADVFTFLKRGDIVYGTYVQGF